MMLIENVIQLKLHCPQNVLQLQFSWKETEFLGDWVPHRAELK